MTLGKLWELADLADMPSVPTLRRLMREHADFPIVERGRRGAEYVIDLERAAAFVRSHWGDARLRKTYGTEAEADQQISLPLELEI